MTFTVDAVACFRGIGPVKTLVNVRDYRGALPQIHPDLASEGDGRRTGEPWGLRVERVEIKDVALSESMLRSMSQQAEAERERWVRGGAADGESRASQRLTSPRRRTARWSCRSGWRCSADIRELRRRHITCPWLIPARLCDSPRASAQRRGFRRPCWMRCWRRTGRGRCTGFSAAMFAPVAGTRCQGHHHAECMVGHRPAGPGPTTRSWRVVRGPPSVKSRLRCRHGSQQSPFFTGCGHLVPGAYRTGQSFQP